MVKSIGNLVSNLRPKDKVSAKLQARFGGKSLRTHAAAGQAPASNPTNSAKPPPRFKKRKR